MALQQRLPARILLHLPIAIFFLAAAFIAHAAPTVIKDVPYGGMPRQVLDIYQPSRANKGQLLPIHVFVHGGAWKMGDKRQHREMGDFYANRGVLFIAINYRLFPKDPHPAQIEDVAAAVKWIYDHANEYGGDRHHLVLSGHSAGAHLVALAASDQQYLAKHQLRTDFFRALVPVDTASFDLTTRESGGPLVRAVNRVINENFGPGQNELRSASPTHRGSHNQNLPAFYLFVTSKRPDAIKQTQDFAAVLKQSGAPSSEVHVIAGLSHRGMMRAMSKADSPVAQRILQLLVKS